MDYFICQPILWFVQMLVHSLPQTVMHVNAYMQVNIHCNDASYSMKNSQVPPLVRENKIQLAWASDYELIKQSP